MLFGMGGAREAYLLVFEHIDLQSQRSQDTIVVGP